MLLLLLLLLYGLCCVCCVCVLQGYRAEVRRTFEATEKIFAADMKWRDDWAEDRKQERRNGRRKAKRALKEAAAGGEQQQQQQGKDSLQNGGGRIFPEGEGDNGGRSSTSVGQVVSKNRDRCSSGRVLPDEGDSSSGGGRIVRAGREERLSSTVGGGGASGAERCSRNPEVGEGGMGGEEEGLPIATPVRKNSEKQAPENGPGDHRGEPTANNGGSCRASDVAAAAGVVETAATVAAVSGEPDETARKLSAPKLFSGVEDRGNVEGTSGEDPSNSSLLDRTRGPCQGSGLLEKPRQGLEEQQDHQALPGAADGGVSPLLVGEAAAAAAQTREGAEGSQQAALSGGLVEEKGDMAV